MKNFKLSCLSIVAILSITSCTKKEDPAPVNEEEVITTVTITLTNPNGNVVLKSKDADGDGPAQPVLTPTENLVAGRTYVGSVTFLNELVTPATNITDEVQAEGQDHQIFYQANSTVGTFAYTDTDANGKPIGLAFTFTAAAANSTQQNLTVTLRHEPIKTAVGVAAGNIANAGGSTDAEVVYKVVINP